MSGHSQLIVALFDDDDEADAARETLRRMAPAHPTLGSANIAVLRKGEDGAVTVDESAEAEQSANTTMLGQLVGWVLGAAAAVLGSPIGVMQSAAAGQVAAEDLALRVDTGFPNEELRRLGEHLNAGTSALLTLVRAEDAPDITAALEQAGGRIAQGTLPPATIARLSGER